MPRKKKTDSTKKMFKDPSGQVDFIEQSYEEEQQERRNQPVECLGMKFQNDETRREHFLGELAKKLTDSEFRKIEGFPIGKDEDILSLSDPPYYTACPNPWLAEVTAEWEKSKPAGSKSNYSREPFATDVSEGKGDLVYNAHSYHTKVPPKAIMRYILHYTDPGDVIFDGFCGTGMTGVAAQMCGDQALVRTLDQVTGLSDKRPKLKCGSRKSVISDLSPMASFVAHGYNSPIEPETFRNALREFFAELDKACSWLYHTNHSDGTQCRIDYTVWSEVFACHSCSSEVVFLKEAMRESAGSVRKEFPCPHCGAMVSKRSMTRVMETYRDLVDDLTCQRVKRTPVFIKYRVNNKVVEKEPDTDDLRLLSQIDEKIPSGYFPADEVPFMHVTHVKDRMSNFGITHFAHFFLPRPQHALSAMWAIVQNTGDAAIRHALQFMVEQCIVGMSILNRYSPTHYSQANRVMSGVYYVPSQHSEVSPWYILRGKSSRLLKVFDQLPRRRATAVSLGSGTCVGLPDDSVDYIFTDPPFGENLQYSELNWFVESFYRVLPATATEAVVNKAQDKDIRQYSDLMLRCFQENHRILKAGHWMTVEFHNSRNAIWTAIQEAMLRAGFVVADVRILDKQGETYKQSQQGVVKADLVISAYKPRTQLEHEFKLAPGSESVMWAFVSEHLRQLPVFVASGKQVEPVQERMSFLLFDRMVAFHVQRAATVPLSFAEFERGLLARYPCRDGMFFLSEQVNEYERSRAKYSEILQLELFVQDEASAIGWLRMQLGEKPQSFSDLHPLFMKELGGWQKFEKSLELKELLQENFLCFDGKGEVPSQIHSYLSTNWKSLRGKPKDSPELIAKAKGRWYAPDPKRAEDLEKIRERALLREFWEYLPEGHKPQAKPDYQDELPGLVTTKTKISTGKRVRVIRTEAVRTGFKYCWQNQDYRTIIAVAKRIPEDVLQEDPKLLMWYDQALTRLGEE